MFYKIYRLKKKKIPTNHACLLYISKSSLTSSLEPKNIGHLPCKAVGCMSKIGILPLDATPPASSIMYAIGLPSYNKRNLKIK